MLNPHDHVMPKSCVNMCLYTTLSYPERFGDLTSITVNTFRPPSSQRHIGKLEDRANLPTHRGFALDNDDSRGSMLSTTV